MSSSKVGLGSLASLAGINLNQGSSTSDSYLSPLLYSKIANSDEFSLKLIEEELINLKGMTQGMLVILGQKNIKKR